MDIETLVDEIMEAFESEPDTDFGNESINQAIRRQGIRAHIWYLLQDYSDDLFDPNNGLLLCKSCYNAVVEEEEE